MLGSKHTAPFIQRSCVRPGLCKHRPKIQCAATAASAEHMQQIDVAVIGAGPAGLATALAIKAVASKLKIKVYDKARALRPIGAGITVFGNGLDAIHAILGPEAYKQFEAAGTAMGGVEARSDKDEVLVSSSTQNYNAMQGNAAARAPLLFSWHGIQSALLQVLGQEHLELNKAVVAIKQQGDGSLQQPPVEISFQDGTTVQAHMVVGADGNMSAVRGALFDGEQPKYIGTAFWRAMIRPLPAWWEHKEGWVTSWNSAGQLLAIRTFSDHLSVSAAAAWPAERLQELYGRTYYGAEYTNAQLESSNTMSDDERHQAKRKRFLEVFGSSRFPERITGLLSEADPSTLIEHGVYYREPSNPWGVGAVTLVGDAAHVMPPNLGQGTSMAFEDAYHVAEQLAAALGKSQGSASDAVECTTLEGHGGAVQQALRAYEGIMRARITPISLASAGNANQFYQNKDAKASPMLPPSKPAQDANGSQVDVRQHITQAAGPFHVLAKDGAAAQTVRAA